jgi:ATP-binding cassette subfamily F protein uup
MGYLDQDPQFEKAYTISDYIFHADNRQQQLIREYEELMENDPENMGIGKHYRRDQRPECLGVRIQIKTILGRLDIHHLNQKSIPFRAGKRNVWPWPVAD